MLPSDTATPIRSNNSAPGTYTETVCAQKKHHGAWSSQHHACTQHWERHGSAQRQA